MTSHDFRHSFFHKIRPEMQRIAGLYLWVTRGSLKRLCNKLFVKFPLHTWYTGRRSFSTIRLILEDSTPCAFCSLFTLPETNITTESLGLEDEFPFGARPPCGCYVSCGESRGKDENQQSPRSWTKGSWLRGCQT